MEYKTQGDADWLKLNAGQTGLYRVHYPDELWERLTIVAARVIDDVPIMPEVGVLQLSLLAFTDTCSRP